MRSTGIILLYTILSQAGNRGPSSREASARARASAGAFQREACRVKKVGRDTDHYLLRK